ncbi:MAG: hypothetical protein J6T10_20405 [Methanobrevibacter sp.]|nr:hypothetical protein [Methanobrevibacter sp.]
MTQQRLEKTIQAVRKLYNCNENTLIQAVFENIYDKTDVVVLFQNTREYKSYLSGKMTKGKFDEYVHINNRYVWGLRVGYFCGVKEEIKRFESLKQYRRIY